jgi:hypothetical protein
LPVTTACAAGSDHRVDLLGGVLALDLQQHLAVLGEQQRQQLGQPGHQYSGAGAGRVNPVEPGTGVHRRDRIDVETADRSAARRRPVQVGVVQQHRDAVRGGLGVRLHPLRAAVPGGHEGRQGVLRVVRGRAAMSDHHGVPAGAARGRRYCPRCPRRGRCGHGFGGSRFGRFRFGGFRHDR